METVETPLDLPLTTVSEEPKKGVYSMSATNNDTEIAWWDLNLLNFISGEGPISLTKIAMLCTWLLGPTCALPEATKIESPVLLYCRER